MRLASCFALVALVLASVPLATPPAAAAVNGILVSEYSFGPDSMTIRGGDDVTWANNGQLDHAVESTSGPVEFETGVIKPQAASRNVHFVTPGTYTYRCSIHQTMTGKLVVTDPAVNQKPTAEYSLISSGLTVVGNASRSIDPDGQIIQYQWKWGDGGTGTGKVAQHTYNASGTYFVRLTVTDDKGDSVARDRPVSVTAGPVNAAPIVNFTIDSTGLTIRADASSSRDPDGSIVFSKWEWGDGTSASGLVANHTYNIPGEYQVSLELRDNRGDKSVAGQSVSVQRPPPPNQPPRPIFTMIVNDMQVTVDGSPSFDGDGAVESFEWDFGDGTFDDAIRVDHVYDRVGNYTIRLRVVDDRGANASLSREAIVGPQGQAPDPQLQTFPQNLLVGFDASRSSAGLGIASYAFDFGDGAKLVCATGGSCVASGPGETRNDSLPSRARHTYLRDGAFRATLTITDGANVSKSVSTQVVAASETPLVFKSGVAGQIVTLDATKIPTYGHPNYSWSADDSPVGFGVLLQVALQPGAHDVHLSLRDDAGTFELTRSLTTTLSTPRPADTPPPASKKALALDALAPLAALAVATILASAARRR